MKLLREKLYLNEDDNDLASTIDVDEFEDKEEVKEEPIELDNQDVQEFTDEVSTLDEPVNTELQTIGTSSMITDLITQAWEKVNQYNSVVASLIDMETPQEVVDIIKDVENDLYISIGQLQKALELIDDKSVEAIEDGLNGETSKDEEDTDKEDEESEDETVDVEKDKEESEEESEEDNKEEKEEK